MISSFDLAVESLPVDRFALTMCHSLWQCTLVAVGVWSLCLLLRRRSAQSRYLISLIGMTVMAFGVVATFAFVDVPQRVVDESAEAATVPESVGDARLVSSDVVESAALDTRSHTPGSDRPVVTTVVANQPSKVVPSDGQATGAPASNGQPLRPLNWSGHTSGIVSVAAPVLVVGYLCGVFALLVRLLLGLRGGHCLRVNSQFVRDDGRLMLLERTAKALGLRTTPELRVCRDLAIPTVVGVIRPTIILPLSLLTGLTSSQLEAILTHELAHIRRYDHLVNIWQRVVESLLFYHPAVWWVSKQVRIERENCCDDIVVTRGAEPAGYAALLVDLAEHDRRMKPARGVTLVATLQATGNVSSLSTRVKRLLGVDPRETFRLPRGMLLIVLTAGALLAGGVGWSMTIGASPQVDGGTLGGEVSVGAYRDLMKFKFVPGDGGFPSEELPSGVSLTTLGQDEKGVSRFVVSLAIERKLTDPHCMRLVAMDHQGKALPELEFSFVSARGTKNHLLTYSCRFSGDLDRIAELAIQWRSGAKAKGDVSSANDSPNSNEVTRDGDHSNSLQSTRSRRFVRLVVGPDRMTFEGEGITWEELKEAAKTLRNKRHTVLELAVAMSAPDNWEAGPSIQQAHQFAIQAGFEYLSSVGKHPHGSRGDETQKVRFDPEHERQLMALINDVRDAGHQDRFAIKVESADGNRIRIGDLVMTGNEAIEVLHAVPNRVKTILDVSVATVPDARRLQVASYMQFVGDALGFQGYRFQYVTEDTDDESVEEQPETTGSGHGSINLPWFPIEIHSLGNALSAIDEAFPELRDIEKGMSLDELTKLLAPHSSLKTLEGDDSRSMTMQFEIRGAHFLATFKDGKLQAVSADKAREEEIYKVHQWAAGTGLLMNIVEKFPELADVRAGMSAEALASTLPDDTALQPYFEVGVPEGDCYQFSIGESTFLVHFVNGKLANFVRLLNRDDERETRSEEASGETSKSADEDDALGPPLGLTPRETVQGFIDQIAKGKQDINGMRGTWDHAWAWTTREHSMSLGTPLAKRPNFKPIAHLGNDQRMIVLTGTERESVSSVQDRVGVFELVRRDRRWLIKNMELRKPESAWSYAAGYARSDDVQWHVLPSDLIGRFFQIHTKYDLFKSNGQFVSVGQNGTITKGTWSLKDGQFASKDNEGKVWLQGRVSPFQEGFFIEYKEGYRTGFYRSEDQDEDSHGSSTPLIDATKTPKASSNADEVEESRDEGRVINVPEWPQIELPGGGIASFGSFEVRKLDDSLSRELCVGWKTIEPDNGVVDVPAVLAVQLSIHSYNNTDLSALGMLGPGDLQSLSVPTQNKLDDRALPNIAKMTGLVRLELGGVSINDQGVANLVALKNIRYLSLQGCNISDAAIESLSELKSLKELNLRQTNITIDGQVRLTRALPGCRITRSPP